MSMDEQISDILKNISTKEIRTGRSTKENKKCR